MAKKKEYNLFNKIRQALRDIYRYSPMRREAIKKVIIAIPGTKDGFVCPICKAGWPVQMADVDHEPPLGTLGSLLDDTTAAKGLGRWSSELFYGPVQVICKLCHKKKTAAQRKKK